MLDAASRANQAQPELRSGDSGGQQSLVSRAAFRSALTPLKSAVLCGGRVYCESFNPSPISTIRFKVL